MVANGASMERKEIAMKGPQDSAHLVNGHEPHPSPPPPPARRLTIISWTTFSVGVNIALLAMMFVQPSSPSDWFSNPRVLKSQENLKKSYNGSAACNVNAESNKDGFLCLPRPTSPRLSSFASEHLQLCSGNGHYVIQEESEAGACHCHACFSGVHCEQLDPDCHLNLFHGDPTLFEEYWLTQPEAPTVIPSWQGMSYFAHRNNDYLFVDYFLEQAIRKIHGMVGNAVTEGRYLVLGVGSTQMYQAALYALSSGPESPTPTPVVSATPHYSSFEGCTKFLDSRRYKWVGDAAKFKARSELQNQPYIELVTSPNNPCGFMNKPVVNGNGSVVNDLAYYWPHYTAITSPADYPIMLWTLSKISGHAGTRLGWAIVKDAAVAAKMAYFIQLNTLGLSQDAQARGITLLRTIMASYEQHRPGSRVKRHPFFHYGQAVLEDRWNRMRQALHNTSRFVLPEYESSFCSFLGKHFRANPAFLWLKCTVEEDCQQLLKENKIIARGGAVFGVSTQYVRVSMLDRHPLFNLLLARLASLK